MNRACDTCGVAFETGSTPERATGRFCSYSCASSFAEAESLAISLRRLARTLEADGYSASDVESLDEAARVVMSSVVTPTIDATCRTCARQFRAPRLVDRPLCPFCRYSIGSAKDWSTMSVEPSVDDEPEIDSLLNVARCFFHGDTYSDTCEPCSRAVVTFDCSGEDPAHRFNATTRSAECPTCGELGIPVGGALVAGKCVRNRTPMR